MFQNRTFIYSTILFFILGAGDVLSAPPAPTGFVADESTPRPMLRWDKSADASVVGYRVSRAAVSGGPYTTFPALVVENEFRDTQASLGAEHYYVVKAVDGDMAESPPSPEVTTHAVIQNGVPVPFNLNPVPDKRMFRIFTLGDRPLELKLDDAGAGNVNCLFFRWGKPPVPSAFDSVSCDPSKSDQTLIIRRPQRQVGFVRVVRQHATATSSLTLTSSDPEVVLTSLSAERAGKGGTGIVHATVWGAGLNASDVFSFLPAKSEEGGPINCGIVSVPNVKVETFVSAEQIEVSINVKKACVGLYHLVVTKEGTETAELPLAFEVLDDNSPGRLVVELSGSRGFRYNRVSSIQLDYENVGAQEIQAPLFLVEWTGKPQTTFMWLSGDRRNQRESILALGISDSGLADRLPPGGSGSLTINFSSVSCPNCTGNETCDPEDCDVGFRVSLCKPRNEKINWSTLPTPEGMTQADWDTARPVIEEKVGDTWRAYIERLGVVSKRLSRFGEQAASARSSFRFGVLSALGLPDAAILGRVTLSPSRRPLSTGTVLALQGNTVVASADIEADGTYTLDRLSAGEVYEIAVALHRIVEPAGGATMVKTLDDADVLGFDLVVEEDPGGLKEEKIEESDDRLPNDALRPPADLFLRRAFHKISLLKSTDPNEKTGPMDDDDDICPLPAGEEVEFTIFFENVVAEGVIGAAVQFVEIEDSLDPAFFDPESVRFGSIQIGNEEDQRAFFDESVEDDFFVPASDLPPSSTLKLFEVTTTPGGTTQTLPVAATANLDLENSTLHWRIESPRVSDPMSGFLLPTDEAGSSPEAQGYVTFSVRTRAGLNDETIWNDASIVFDDNDPVAADPAWECRIFETVPPQPPSFPDPANDDLAVSTETQLFWSSDGTSYDVHFWSEFDTPPDLDDLENEVPDASDLTARVFGPPSPLNPGTRYFWLVVAKRGSTPSAGEVWTFTTESPLFKRGSANDDDKADISDAVYLLNYLFQSSDAPTCLKAGDVNDDSKLDVSDPVYLLNFLFANGAPPDEPFASCAPDPTPDSLTCREYPACSP